MSGVSESAPPDAAQRTGRIRKTAPSARRAAAETVIVSLAVGLVMGVVWRAVAPEVVVEVSDGDPALFPLQARRLFGLEASFAVLGAAAGMLVALVMFTRHRHRPLATLTGLASGGVLGSIVAWRLGALLGPGSLEGRVDGAPDGTLLPLPLELRATGVLLVWSVVAVVVVLVLNALVEDRTLWRVSTQGRAPVRTDDRSVRSSPP